MAANRTTQSQKDQDFNVEKSLNVRAKNYVSSIPKK